MGKRRANSASFVWGRTRCQFAATAVIDIARQAYGIPPTELSAFKRAVADRLPTATLDTLRQAKAQASAKSVAD